MQKIYPQAYLVSLSNFLVSSLKKESEEEYMDKLERIKRLAKTSPAMEIQAWQNYYYNYVNYLFSGLEFDKTIEQSGEIAAGFEKYGAKLGKDYRLTTGFMVAFAFFANERYEEALDWLV